MSCGSARYAVLLVGDLAMRAERRGSVLCRRGLVGWLSSDGRWPDRVLDLEELIGIRLAVDTDEDVAGLVPRTVAAQSVTNNASLSRGRHSTIFAQSLEAGVWDETIDAPSFEHCAVVARAKSCCFRAVLHLYR